MKEPFRGGFAGGRSPGVKVPGFQKPRRPHPSVPVSLSSPCGVLCAGWWPGPPGDDAAGGGPRGWQPPGAPRVRNREGWPASRLLAGPCPCVGAVFPPSSKAQGIPLTVAARTVGGSRGLDGDAGLLLECKGEQEPKRVAVGKPRWGDVRAGAALAGQVVGFEERLPDGVGAGGGPINRRLFLFFPPFSLPW